MTPLYVLAAKLRASFSKQNDLDQELETHLALLTEDNLRKGMTKEEASRKARVSLGSNTQINETYRDQSRLPQIDTFLQDVRYGWRTLLKSPGFTAVAILTLALGIGANSLIFSVAQILFLKPLPFPDPDRLVNIWSASGANPGSTNIISAPNYRDWKAQSTVFENTALFDSAGNGYNLAGLKDPERVPGLRTTASLFATLGFKPLLGRTYTEEEEMLGRHRVVVLSYGLWQRRYGGDRSLIGRDVRIDGEAFTVVGVMPPDFAFSGLSGIGTQLWVPVGFDSGDQQRNSNSFGAIGRLKPQISVTQAKVEMDIVGRRIAKQYANAEQGPLDTATVTPLSGLGTASLRSMFIALFAVVGFVLLIACANVANLMLARGASRQKELSIRRALGAGRLRIVRQLLTESLLLALMGGALGLALAAAGNRVLQLVLPQYLGNVPYRSFDNIALDGDVFLFTLAVCCLTASIFGTIAAFGILKHDLNDALKERSATTRGGRLRYALVAAEVALALGVIAGAGLMMESMMRVLRVDPGFDTKNLLTLNISLPQQLLYYGPPTRSTFCRELSERAGAIPGVLGVSAISHLPIGGGSAGRAVFVEGQPDPGTDKRPNGVYAVACPDYFRTMGVTVLAGREFDHRDAAGSLPVVLVNQTMAQRVWPKTSPVGQRIRLTVSDDEPWLTVVGVVGDIHHRGLDRDVPPELYRPYTQAAWPGMTVVTRTAGAALGYSPRIKQTLLAIDPDQATSGEATMEEILFRSLGSRRLPTFLLAAFGIIALLLAAIGISGVVSYSVAQRKQELGIRIAMGASRLDVLKLVVGHSMGWTFAGVILGIAASYGLAQLIANMLFGVKPLDPAVLSSASLILSTVALIACYLPARRATKLDPIIALRCE